MTRVRCSRLAKELDLRLLALAVGAASFLGCATPPVSPEVAGRAAALQARFEIALVFENVASVLETLGPSLRGASPGNPALRTYLPWLEDQLAAYPDDAFACARIDRVILTANLRVTNARPRGYRSRSTGGDRRSAVPAFADNALVLDIAPLRTSTRYQARVLHHEFFHFLDHATARDVADPEWIALNPQGFAYGSGGRNTSRFVDYLSPTHPRPGFLTAYGATSAAEDKAELYSLLFTESKLVRERSGLDAVLGKKIQLLRERLAQQCPGLWPRRT